MTSKKRARKPVQKPAVKPDKSERAITATPAAMVQARESSWSSVQALAQSKSAGLSRNRMMEARGDLLRSEREYIALSSEIEASMNEEAQELQRKAAQLQSEAWAIEQETQTRVSVLKSQARMEASLAKHIKDIAERSALSVLDRIKEASDSLMNYAELIGGDLTGMLKQEAAQQVERTAAEIGAIEEAMDEEGRAAELLELTARYQKDLAA